MQSMMVDIFSTFDDHNLVFLSASICMWLMSMLMVIMFNFGLWIKKSRWELTTIFPMQFMGSQIMQSYSLNLGGLLCFVVSLFMMLLMMNMVGLLPYIFSSTSHLAVTFNLAFPIWLTLLISSIMKNPYHFTAALLPSGAPAILNPFLILVEMVSLSVRPITLAVRLTANMAAGHIVLGLVGAFLKSNIFLNNMLVALTLTITQVFYFLFEFGVSVIQGYIFCLLIILYATEHSYA